MALVALFLVLGATLASLLGGSGRHCARVLVVSIVGVVVSGAASASVSRLDAPAACSRSTSAYWCAAELNPSSMQFSAANQVQVALPPRTAAASRLFTGQFENCQTVRFTDPFTRSYDAHPLLRVSHYVTATKTGACRNSFVAETLVLMADGSTKRIDQVEVGDMVMATDAETGKTVAHEVLDLITGEGEKHLVDVKIRTKDGVRTIVATRGHPFWVDDKGVFLRADHLREGDDLRTPDGGEVEVVSISQHTEWIKVHNLTVEGVHTYYVLAGRQPVLVHNAGGSVQGPISVDEAIRQATDFVGPNGKLGVSGSGGYQWISTETVNGKVVTRIARLDINPANTHVQGQGPHLNLETQVNGNTVKSGPLADPHTPVDASTARPGDIPC